MWFKILDDSLQFDILNLESSAWEFKCSKSGFSSSTEIKTTKSYIYALTPSACVKLDPNTLIEHTFKIPFEKELIFKTVNNTLYLISDSHIWSFDETEN